ncbi:oxidoreductase [Thioclava sp. SK-1]|uniref:SDR family NAD(P)-dependent oxidoreductase n=1 Tax=Thioclava sp. SK-1 TaxID=1889770 RepID=UPI000826F053|nr:SDR family NAD(P)-dependent oxidoreductase [Thioclava sp. SK-1]OCX66577.1 oxidoreductase [Thioclava sp. SK-1]
MKQIDTHTPLALVTGASRGLGAAMAEALAAQGWHVLAVARTVGALEELDDRIKQHGGQATLAPLNVTDPAQMQHLGQSIASRWGGVGLWVHTAIHSAPLAPAAHIAQKDMESSITTNMTTTAMMIPMMEALLKARGGRAVFFDDPRAGQKFFGSYGATKAGQMALVRSWAAETAKTGPEVIVAQPEPMPTALRARFFPGEDRAPLSDIRTQAAQIIEAHRLYP